MTETLLVLICSSLIVLIYSIVLRISKERERKTFLKGALSIFLYSMTVLFCVVYYCTVFNMSGGEWVAALLYIEVSAIAAIINTAISLWAALSKNKAKKGYIEGRATKREWCFICVRIILVASMLCFVYNEHLWHYSPEAAQSRYYDNLELFEDIKRYIGDNYDELNEMRKTGYPSEIVIGYVNQRVFYISRGNGQSAYDEKEIEFDDETLVGIMSSLFSHCRVNQINIKTDKFFNLYKAGNNNYLYHIDDQYRAPFDIELSKGWQLKVFRPMD